MLRFINMCNVRKIGIVLSVVVFCIVNVHTQTMPCSNAGPQAPRDISNFEGENTRKFPEAPVYTKMNLCNIHIHTNAEHKGPDFSIRVKKKKGSGFACNETSTLTQKQLKDPFKGKGSYKNVKPGDTIEVHWVHTSCNVKPGKGLEACLNKACSSPKLRVEAQVFLLVNDPYALNFFDYVYANTVKDGFHQAKSIPLDTGKPIQFLGSSTGPKYTQKICSPLKVTWSVRPQCAKLDISSLHAWAKKGNVFKEKKSHGVRPLVTKKTLLSPIKK